MRKGRPQTIEERIKRSNTIKQLYASGKIMGFRSEKGKEAIKLSPRDYWKGKKLPYKVWNKGMDKVEYTKHYPNGWNKTGLGKTGPQSPSWKGGITPLRQKIKETKEWKQWIKKVMERDNYSCVFCGEHNNNLHVDHIVPYAVIRKKYNILTVQDAIMCKELWNTNNGRVLCIPCHKKTDTYLSKAIRFLTK